MKPAEAIHNTYIVTMRRASGVCMCLEVAAGTGSGIALGSGNRRDHVGQVQSWDDRQGCLHQLRGQAQCVGGQTGMK